MKLIDFFAGVARFETDAGSTGRLFDILMKARLVYRDLSVTDGRCVLYCSLRTAKRLAELCGSAGIDASFGVIYGLPGMGGAFRRRAGLVIGAVAALVILAVGSSVIWDVRVTGCGKVLTVTEAESLFASLGIRPGVMRFAVDADGVAAEAVRKSEKLAWAAVNIRGTTAVIEVREQVDPPGTVADPFEGFDGVNLVASCDGLVVDMEVISGKPTVARGQSVREGDLLVSGVIDSTRIGFRLTHADGEVRAETTEMIEVEIPYKYEKKQPDGRQELEIWLIFFSGRLQLFKKGGNTGADRDTIYTEDLIALPGGKVVPVGIGSRRSVGYVYTDAERTPEEAARLAEFVLSRRIADALQGGAYPVRRTVARRADEDAYRIECELVAVRNIAKKSGFSFGITGGTNE